MNFITGAAAEKQGAHTLGIRPEHLSVSNSTGEWSGKVGVAEHLGSDTFLRIHLDDGSTITARHPVERMNWFEAVAFLRHKS